MITFLRRIDWATIGSGLLFLLGWVLLCLVAVKAQEHAEQDCRDRGGTVYHAHNADGWICQEAP